MTSHSFGRPRAPLQLALRLLHLLVLRRRSFSAWCPAAARCAAVGSPHSPCWPRISGGCTPLRLGDAPSLSHTRPFWAARGCRLPARCFASARRRAAPRCCLPLRAPPRPGAGRGRSPLLESLPSQLWMRALTRPRSSRRCTKTKTCLPTPAAAPRRHCTRVPCFSALWTSAWLRLRRRRCCLSAMTRPRCLRLPLR